MTPFELEARHRRVVNLAQIVIESRHIQPVAVRIDHAPAGQIVERSAPQDRFLAARIHGDIAADARCFGRCRIDCEYKPGLFRCIGYAFGHHAGA